MRASRAIGIAVGHAAVRVAVAVRIAVMSPSCGGADGGTLNLGVYLAMVHHVGGDAPQLAEVARQLFFQGLDDTQAAHFQSLLVPESPRRVYEATRWTLAVDAAKLTAPILVVSGALDRLTPPETGAALAKLYGATYRLEPEHGHNVLLGSGATRIAADVAAWIGDQLGR